MFNYYYFFYILPHGRPVPMEEMDIFQINKKYASGKITTNTGYLIHYIRHE